MKSSAVSITQPSPYPTYNAMDKKIKIFVVEDSVIYRELIASFIYTSDRAYLTPEESYFDIRSFSTGEHCLGEIDEKPDIVVLDYFLDGYHNPEGCMDGMETLKRIKKRSPNTHVIVVSSNRDSALANEFILKGASDYVSKEPGVREKLQHSIARIIRLIKKKQQIGFDPDPLT